MLFASWLKTRKTLAKHVPIRRRTFAPRLEGLEDRLAPATFTVINTLNSGTGSLRQAILDSNASVGVQDTINFEIGAGVQTIAPTTALPTITDAVTIDGTAPAALPTQRIELNGASAGSSNGLAITAGGSTVRGLTINRFSSAGIDLRTGGGNRIEGCIIGLDPTGTIDLGNLQGLIVFASADNVIGGTAAGTGNVVSGNNFGGMIFTQAGTQRNQIQGNFVGTNAAGTATIGNSNGISFNTFAANNTLGGSDPAARNVISGNGHGVAFSSAGGGTVIIGNYVGTDVTGTVKLGNAGFGINTIGAGLNTRIGGTAPAERNVISGNTQGGVLANSNSLQVLGNYIGTDATGTAPLGNGINLAQSGIVVGAQLDVLIRGNVISANTGPGVNIISNSGVAVPTVRVEGNRIGTSADGTADLGNRAHGVSIGRAGPSNIRIGGTGSGEGNLIAYNDGAGVSVFHQNARGVAILGNSIYANDGLGIDLAVTETASAVGVTPNDLGDADGGANALQNYPVLSTITSSGGSTTIDGTLNSTANTTFRLEFYSNLASDPTGFGEGQTYLGFIEVTTDAAGNVAFAATVPGAVSSAHFVTATATRLVDDDANPATPLVVQETSEFSQGKNPVLLNSPPTANAGPDQTAPEGATVSFNGTGSTDPDGDSLTYSWDFGDGSTGTGATPTHAYADNGSYEVVLTVEDGKGGSSSDSLTVTVNNVAPTAVNDSAATDEDQAVTIAVLPNDTDPAGALDPLQIVAVTNGAKGSTFLDTKGTPATADDEIIYTPNLNATGNDSFTYTVSDGDGGSATTTVTVTITPVNDAPTAANGSLTTAEDTGATGTLVATDIDSVTLTYSLVDATNAHGTVTITDASTGAYSYSPDADYNGPASFTFKANDGSLDSNVTTVSITVNAVNDAPVAQGQFHTTNEDTAVNGALAATDIDSATLTYGIIVGPSHGTVTLNTATGAFIYTPAADYNGADSFTFKANDGALDSNIATVSITVTGVNDAPVITSDGGGDTAARSVPENTTAVTTVTAVDPDVGATKAFTISGGADAARFAIDPASGMLRFLTAPDFEAPTDADANNVYLVQVQVSDGTLADTQMIAVTLTDVIDQSPVYIGPGCCDPTALVVQGTEGNDNIRIIPQGCGGAVKVRFNGTDYSFASGSFTSIVVHGKGGDDDIRIAGSIDQHACLYGGAGNDCLQGGAGDDVLLGGDGCDTLLGGQGRDLLIGGMGADRLIGNAEDDILIAGTTDFDANDAALCAIMDEWTRCDLGYTQRAAHLHNGGGLNGGVKLNDGTVHDDGARDVLTGSAGRDWFFANLDCGVLDIITDDHANERMDDIDP